MSTVIKDGTIVTADRTYKADLLVENGKITKIGEGLSGNETLDATGCYVMPGGIDPHTHLEMPFMGTYSSDDFESGTRAALSGGTTMVVDFCLPAPDQSLLTAIQAWDNKSTRATTDYSFHMAITWWGEQVFNEMPEVVSKGINTFKHFMAYKGALMVDDDEMYASFQRCAELGAMPLVHAENGDVVAQLQAKLMEEGNNGPEGHAYSRPPEVEGEATNRAIMIADMAGVPLYVVHVSCEQSHEAIRRARQKGMRVFGEPLIQHLLLDESEYAHPNWDHAAQRVMSPPFRNKLHQDSLWAGLHRLSRRCVVVEVVKAEIPAGEHDRGIRDAIQEAEAELHARQVRVPKSVVGAHGGEPRAKQVDGPKLPLDAICAHSPSPVLRLVGDAQRNRAVRGVVAHVANENLVRCRGGARLLVARLCWCSPLRHHIARAALATQVAPHK